MYSVNQNWLLENKDNIFNYSYDNSQDFDDFITRMQFPTLEDKLLNKKEKNQLITKLTLPIESIDKIYVYRYSGHFRAINYLRHLVPQVEEIRHFEEGGYQVNKLAKLHEFIIK
jgi:hypothetical protein